MSPVAVRGFFDLRIPDLQPTGLGLGVSTSCPQLSKRRTESPMFALFPSGTPCGVMRITSLASFKSSVEEHERQTWFHGDA